LHLKRKKLFKIQFEKVKHLFWVVEKAYLRNFKQDVAQTKMLNLTYQKSISKCGNLKVKIN